MPKVRKQRPNFQKVNKLLNKHGKVYRMQDLKAKQIKRTDKVQSSDPVHMPDATEHEDTDAYSELIKSLKRNPRVYYEELIQELKRIQKWS